ncbi:hypothetical protein EVA_21251, partial [gut metagenome]
YCGAKFVIQISVEEKIHGIP